MIDSDHNNSLSRSELFEVLKRVVYKQLLALGGADIEYEIDVSALYTRLNSKYSKLAANTR